MSSYSDFAVKSGDVFRWVGLPGQEDPERRLAVDSMTAECGINARILGSAELPTFVTIPAADFFAALGAGWLVKR